MSIDRARIHAAVDALLDAMEAMVADLRQPASPTTPERPKKTAGLTKKELGAAIGKSTSTNRSIRPRRGAARIRWGHEAL